jgi:hypothetical protein
MTKYVRTECPECGGHVYRGKCRACSWVAPGHQQESRAADTRCCYAEGSQRCPLPGTISDAAYPPQPTLQDPSPRRQMWCRWHFAARGNSAIMHAILQDAQHMTGAHEQNWCETVLLKRQAELGLTLLPGETKSQLAARAREMFRGFKADGTLARIGRRHAQHDEATAEREAIQGEDEELEARRAELARQAEMLSKGEKP